LQDCELAQLNRAANIRKSLIKLLDELIEAEAEARLARKLIEFRNSQPGGRAPLQMDFRFETHSALPAPAKKAGRPRRAKEICA